MSTYLEMKIVTVDLNQKVYFQLWWFFTNKNMSTSCLKEIFVVGVLSHLLGHSNQLSDVVKLFFLDGEKQHIKLGSKWKLISERLLYYFQFHAHIKVFGEICPTNDLYDKKWSKIIKI